MNYSRPRRATRPALRPDLALVPVSQRAEHPEFAHLGIDTPIPAPQPDMEEHVAEHPFGIPLASGHSFVASSAAIKVKQEAPKLDLEVLGSQTASSASTPRSTSPAQSVILRDAEIELILVGLMLDESRPQTHVIRADILVAPWTSDLLAIARKKSPRIQAIIQRWNFPNTVLLRPKVHGLSPVTTKVHWIYSMVLVRVLQSLTMTITHDTTAAWALIIHFTSKLCMSQQLLRLSYFKTNLKWGAKRPATLFCAYHLLFALFLVTYETPFLPSFVLEMSPTSKVVSQLLESHDTARPESVNGVVSTTRGFGVGPAGITLPIYLPGDNGVPTVLQVTSSIALPTFIGSTGITTSDNLPSLNGVPALTSSIAPPASIGSTGITTFGNLHSLNGVPVLTKFIALPASIGSTGITTSGNSFLTLTVPSTSTLKEPIAAAGITTFNPTRTASSTYPHMPLFSTPVSSTLNTSDPGSVSPVMFSQLQTSFSAIRVSSNILTAEVFLYGAYVVMFGVYLKVLWWNREESLDTIFILRCYAIWNFQLKIIIVPVLLTFAVTGVGHTNAFWPLHTPNTLRSADSVVAEFSFKLLKISILLSICTTVILMVLTAGRIWWIARTARTLLGPTVISKYYTACAMILESGAIYCVSAIAFATIGFTLDQWTTGAILGQLVGIAPTIIAVRVGLGHSVSSVESFEVVKQGGKGTSGLKLWM
ncbi:hypothetical protein B0H16DRAFT_1893325 [Mycena metata]|uniref:Uncharacterized protein n=1 Tax=Mycena metata TaxID=1033252 RepID=A0AAD7HZB7_9AGAR|nr:hypothetical protein B0H16DRAFT_1893325 [Mycena metata]